MNNKDKNHINIDQILDLYYQVLFNLATLSLDVAVQYLYFQMFGVEFTVKLHTHNKDAFTG